LRGKDRLIAGMTRVSLRLGPARSVIAVCALTVAVPLAAQSSSDTLASLVASGNITCAVTTSGQGYCWGGRHAAPYRLLGPDGRPARFGSLTPRSWARCGLDVDGRALCDPSMLGGWADSAGKPVSIPANASCRFNECVMLLSVTGIPNRVPLQELTAGTDHACALALNGAAYCWGHNHMGQLGSGSWTPDSTGSTGAFTRTPTAVAGGLRFTQLSAGEMLTCGITRTGGTVFCWGYGQSGATGDSSVMKGCDGPRGYHTKSCSSASPTRVTVESLPGERHVGSGVRFVQVAAGMRLACATSSDGGAWCWGGNYRCVLGRCRSPESALARRIQVPGRVVEVGAGYWHACARTADFRVFCWGDNRLGQLGSLVTANAGPDGGPPDYRAPDGRAATTGSREDPCFLGGRCSPAAVEVSPGRRWAALAVGHNHACALAADDGGIYCWGGTDPAVLGGRADFVLCENRSPDWKDERCQPTPVKVPGLPSLAPLRTGNRSPGVPAATRVLASRREVRVLFPRDTMRVWGWADLGNPSEDRTYRWQIGIGTPSGPRVLILRVEPTDSTARDFTSLSTLVAAGHASLCGAGMIMTCDQTKVSATVENGGVVLSLRDRARIAELFEMRPASVAAYHRVPYDESPWSFDTVRVEYIAPEIPEPDATLRAAAAEKRRRYEISIHQTSRHITGGPPYTGLLWLAVGDSMRVGIAETQCTYDVCSRGLAVVTGSGWVVGDSSIAALHGVSQGAALRPPEAFVVARRPGRTTLRIDGLTGPSDTMPSRTHPERSITRDVLVTVPVDRVRILPRPDSVVVGSAVQFSLQALDRAGQVIEGAPVIGRFDTGRHTQGFEGPGPFRAQFDVPGRRTLVASLGTRADTVAVMVVPARKP
jgi:alpha-tubulin suppressor-like RCC1 family protein